MQSVFSLKIQNAKSSAKLYSPSVKRLSRASRFSVIYSRSAMVMMIYRAPIAPTLSTISHMVGLVSQLHSQKRWMRCKQCLELLETSWI